MGLRVDDLGQHLAREAEGDGAGDIRLERPAIEQPGIGASHFGFEQAIGGHQLTLDAIDPRLMLLLGRTQVALVDDLHGFLAGRERQADDALRADVGVHFIRDEPQLGGGQPLAEIEDQAGVDQDGSVVGDQRRRLHDRIDRGKGIEGREHRQRLMVEVQALEGEGDRNAAHVGRIQQSDQLHGGVFLFRVGVVGCDLFDRQGSERAAAL